MKFLGFLDGLNAVLSLEVIDLNPSFLRKTAKFGPIVRNLRSPWIPELLAGAFAQYMEY